ncbi:MAG: DEAD/DEAH box helicase [Ignavibacteria bacterium]|nr:DEAD/DEAH box helicase [Ignavibacteria bacterium]
METLKFEDLSLSKEVTKAVADLGFEEATPIQSQAIPFLLEGRDLIGQAQTGTGKTAAFGIPVIEKIDAASKLTQAIVLCPTRELAIQVAEGFSDLLKYKKGIKVLPVYGGQSIERQLMTLRKGVQIIIATPGRLMDHLERRTIKFDNVHTVVFDEADEMLNMGFRDDIESILKQVPKERQTIFFSATMPKPILDLTRKYLKNPEHVKVVHKELTVPNIQQFYYEIKPNMKLEVLTRLIDVSNPTLSLVFCNTKRTVDTLVAHLKARGYAGEALHGDLKQSQRDRVMDKFRSGKLDLLVATDVAARGIDVDDIDAVFNYDMPQDEEYYVHRIGRTARAGRTGQAHTFVVGKEFYKIKDIERYTKSKIMRMNPPSSEDVAELRTSSFLDEIRKAIGDGSDLKKYDHYIEKLVAEDFTSYEIAGGLIKLMIKNGEAEKNDLPTISEYDSSSDGRRDRKGDRKRGKDRDRGRERDRDRGDRRERYGNEKSYGREKTFGKDRDRSSGKDKRKGDFKRSGGNMVRLFMNVGKKSKVGAGDILGAIAGESGISGSQIGAIDMYDKFSFVEVDKKVADTVVESMHDNTIKGNRVSVDFAKDRE